jgi:hypothetical protein
MKRGIVKALPTQQIVASDGEIRPVPRPVNFRDLLGLPRAPIVRTPQPEIVIDLDKLEEINISKATGVKRELLIIAKNQTIRQLQKNIDDLVNGDQTQSELQKFRKIQDTLMRVKAMDPSWKVKLKF